MYNHQWNISDFIIKWEFVAEMPSILFSDPGAMRFFVTFEFAC